MYNEKERGGIQEIISLSEEYLFIYFFFFVWKRDEFHFSSLHHCRYLIFTAFALHPLFSLRRFHFTKKSSAVDASAALFFRFFCRAYLHVERGKALERGGGRITGIRTLDDDKSAPVSISTATRLTI